MEEGDWDGWWAGEVGWVERGEDGSWRLTGDMGHSSGLTSSPV